MTAHPPPAPASFQALTPTAYLDRSAVVHRDATAVVDGERRWTYSEFQDRCLRQAGMLAEFGAQPGERVAVLAPNTHLMLESHYGVLYAGCVLVALNVRLSIEELRYIVGHCDARVLLCAPELRDIGEAIASSLPDCRVISGGAEYESLLANAVPARRPVSDERSLMSLNYTSGTTGLPKAVMYHYRGAYLQALAMTVHFSLDAGAVYLWTLPMFHCNGWTFTWAVTAAGGTHVCLPKVDPDEVWRLIAAEGVTHLCAAPTVLVAIVNSTSAGPIEGRELAVAVGGAPPAPALLEHCAALGLSVTHLYGLTETFGPVAICDWPSAWNDLTASEQAIRRSRQGVANVISQQLRLVDANGADVTDDGHTIGEIAVRGNNLMLGYYRDAEATALAIPDGWFRTGDLAVRHPDNYLEIRDRIKDVIISGGENISSVEVEAVLISHPDVLEAAVVAAPHPRWGERPVAWVTLRPGAGASAEELRDHVRQRLAAFKVPDTVTFAELPKTASGKIRKVELRDPLWGQYSRVGSVGNPE